MTSMKFRMTKKCPYDEKPEIGYTYDLIYIHSECLAECIGSEGTGEYYIIENNEIIGSNKILERGYSKGILQNSIDKSSIPYLTLIHIGKLRVSKINKWGSHKYGFEFAIVGEPELFDKPIYDGENVDIWNRYINELITKYNWKPHLHS